MKRKNIKQESKKKAEKKHFVMNEKVAGTLKELAEKEILELKGILEKTPITPDSQIYIQLYEAMKSLYFCRKYELAMKISWMLKVELLKES